MGMFDVLIFHEDTQGAFKIDALKDKNIEWLKQSIRTRCNL